MASKSSENTEGEVLPEIRTLTQEAINKQIKEVIASPTRHLEEMTPSVELEVQRMVTTPHPSHYQGTNYRTISGTAVHQTDMVLKATPTQNDSSG